MNAAAAKKRRKFTDEEKLAVLVEVEARETTGETIPTIAKRHSVHPSLIYYWMDRKAHGVLIEPEQPAPRTRGKDKRPRKAKGDTVAPGSQLALDGVAVARLARNAPTFVNPQTPLPDAVQLALLRRNNGVLKALVHQLLEHL